MSSATGDSTSLTFPVAGCWNATREACSAWRGNPASAAETVGSATAPHRGSPYTGSPTIGQPRAARCTLIW